MDSYKVRKGSKKKKGGEVFFDASGRDADPATHGNDGAEGEDGGRGTAKNGCDGTDAHSTTPGEAGGQLTITLATERIESGKYYVRLDAEAKSMSTGRNLIMDDDEQYFVPLKELGSVDWSARGGHGCNGGIGGDGGPGGYSAAHMNNGSGGILGGGGTYGLIPVRQSHT
jgi:hypothetical protein